MEVGCSYDKTVLKEVYPVKISHKVTVSSRNDALGEACGAVRRSMALPLSFSEKKNES